MNQYPQPFGLFARSVTSIVCDKCPQGESAVHHFLRGSVPRKHLFCGCNVLLHSHHQPQLLPRARVVLSIGGSRPSIGDDESDHRRRRTRRAGEKLKARVRDHKVCTLTKQAPIDIAHICPNCLISSKNPDRIPNFWKALTAF